MCSVTKVTVRGVPVDTVHGLRRQAAERTCRERGKRAVTLNEIYVEALTRQAAIDAGVAPGVKNGLDD